MQKTKYGGLIEGLYQTYCQRLYNAIEYKKVVKLEI